MSDIEINSPRDAVGPQAVPVVVNDDGTMTDDEVALIAQKIMREYDMETYHGFGMLTISMLSKMLRQAVRDGERNARGPF